MIKIKSIYQPVEKRDGFRILIDDLYQLDISKETVQLDLWLKELASSDDLIKWLVYNHNKWSVYKKK